MKEIIAEDPIAALALIIGANHRTVYEAIADDGDNSLYFGEYHLLIEKSPKPVFKLSLNQEEILETDSEKMLCGAMVALDTLLLSRLPTNFHELYLLAHSEPDKIIADHKTFQVGVWYRFYRTKNKDLFIGANDKRAIAGSLIAMGLTPNSVKKPTLSDAIEEYIAVRLGDATFSYERKQISSEEFLSRMNAINEEIAAAKEKLNGFHNGDKQ
jgi:hypothetical protein